MSTSLTKTQYTKCNVCYHNPGFVKARDGNIFQCNVCKGNGYVERELNYEERQVLLMEQILESQKELIKSLKYNCCCRKRY